MVRGEARAAGGVLRPTPPLAAGRPIAPDVPPGLSAGSRPLEDVDARAAGTLTADRGLLRRLGRAGTLRRLEIIAEATSLLAVETRRWGAGAGGVGAGWEVYSREYVCAVW